MPFTLSHPAAVLPLLRHPFVPAALVAGAMAPDFPYFLRVPVSAQSWYEPLLNATYSHSYEGMLLAGLPTALLLLGVFYFVRRPLLELAPFDIVAPDNPRPPRRSIMAFAIWSIVSALIGLLTHLLWDSLTHTGNWAASAGGYFQETTIAGIPLARLPQHASSVIGLLVLGLWFYRRFKSGKFKLRKTVLPRAQKLQRATLVFSILSVSILLSIVVLLRTMAEDASLGMERILVVLITNTVVHLAACVLLYAMIHRIFSLLKTRNPQKGDWQSSARH